MISGFHRMNENLVTVSQSLSISFSSHHFIMRVEYYKGPTTTNLWQRQDPWKIEYDWRNFHVDPWLNSPPRYLGSLWWLLVTKTVCLFLATVCSPDYSFQIFLLSIFHLQNNSFRFLYSILRARSAWVADLEKRDLAQFKGVPKISNLCRGKAMNWRYRQMKIAFPPYNMKISGKAASSDILFLHWFGGQACLKPVFEIMNEWSHWQHLSIKCASLAEYVERNA